MNRRAYATRTRVPIERSREDILRTLKRYGADSFGFMSDATRDMIVFRAHQLHVRFDVPRPHAGEWQPGPRQRYVAPERKAELLEVAVEAEMRRRWRALLLAIKAKLEMVESGISTFETEFLPHVVTGDGRTVGEHLVTQLPALQAAGGVPLLPAPRAAQE